MDTETVKCAGRIVARNSSRLCDKRGSLEYNGNHWCKTHHPPTFAEKRKARYAKSEAKYEARIREFAQKARDAADILKFRALAKRAAVFAVGIAPDNLGTAVRAILDELAALHQEE